MHPVIQMWLLLSVVTLVTAKWIIKDEESRVLVLFGGLVMFFITGIGYAITHYQ